MSKDENIVSISGAPVFRYTDGEKEWVAPYGEECLEEISNHIETHIGKIEKVFHELVSDTVHVDIHHVRPALGRPFHTLVTSGMSDLSMNVPKKYSCSKYMELMINLPESWKFDSESFKDERWYWPLRLLKFLARFPHKYDTWLAGGHTMPNGDPAHPYADNTRLCAVMILPALNVPEGFCHLDINAKKTIEFANVIPLYEEEINLKLRKGVDALLSRLDSYNISSVLDINRKNTAKKRFGIF